MHRAAEGPLNPQHSPTFTRETCSERYFGMWDKQYVMPSAPDFDLEGLLKASLSIEDTAAVNPDLFSLSPLSSPDATPNGSPLSSVTSTPAPSPKLGCLPLPVDHDSIHTPGAVSAATPLSEGSGSRVSRKKKQSHACRRKRRQRMQMENFATDTREALVSKYVEDAVPIPSKNKVQEAKVTKTAYVGVDDHVRSRKIYQLEELVGSQSKFRFELVVWDGRTSTPIVDISGKVIGVLAGFPGPASEWLRLQGEASRALENARRRSEVSSANANHRRGKFATLRCGVSHGSGQKQPGNLQNNDPDKQIAQELNTMEPFKRFAGFATSVMATWAPQLYSYYVEHLGALHARHPELQRNFTSSVFSASTYNLGPRTICFRHTDLANLPFGWCAVTALGSFDPKKGGHLVLWECGLVVEFPPGSTVLLPSAIISHCNVGIAKSESRFSFTQYTAGGLFRWVDNDFQTTNNYRASLSPSELRDLDDRNRNRWSFGLSLLPHLKTLDKSST